MNKKILAILGLLAVLTSISLTGCTNSEGMSNVVSTPYRDYTMTYYGCPNSNKVNKLNKLKNKLKKIGDRA